MVADCIFADPAENNYRDTKPPLAAWAVAEVFRQTGDTAFVRSILPGLLRYHEWWYTHRDHDHNGLCEYGSVDGTIQAARWESGWDNAVRFDSAAMVKISNHAWSMYQESADLNAYLYKEKKCLAALSLVAGDMKHSRKFTADAQRLKAVFSKAFWDEKTGYFFDLRTSTKKPVRVLEANGWIPLWAGVATKTQALRVREHMVNPAEFNTFVPLPSLAARSKGFDGETGYWRGPVWLDQAWFGLNGLRQYGFNRDADELTMKLLWNCEGLLDPSHPIRENYNPLTGKGLNAKDFSWSAAHILMMLSDLTAPF
jgi:putative isomerase